jgi:hypothetical protein
MTVADIERRVYLSRFRPAHRSWRVCGAITVRTHYV